jgi:DNA-binding transcriptional regulator PaaX
MHRDYLRDRGLGYLQKSVWTTPNPLEEEREILAGGKINVESLILLEARSCAGESGTEMVAGAWDLLCPASESAGRASWRCVTERCCREGVAVLGCG